jgi:hypothetical protein
MEKLPPLFSPWMKDQIQAMALNSPPVVGGFGHETASDRSA